MSDLPDPGPDVLAIANLVEGPFRLSPFAERALIVCVDLEREHCTRCGAALVRTIELDGRHHPETGEPTAMIWHSCPMWLPEPWTVRTLLRRILSIGMPRAMGHDSHSERNPLIARGYR